MRLLVNKRIKEISCDSALHNDTVGKERVEAVEQSRIRAIVKPRRY